MIRLRCPACGKSLGVGHEWAGKVGVCPGCKKKIRIPSEDDPDGPPPATPRGIRSSPPKAPRPAEDVDVEVLEYDEPEEETPRRRTRRSAEEFQEERPARRKTDEYDDERPSGRKRPRYEDDEDEPPRRRRSRYEEDEDEEPARRRPGRYADEDEDEPPRRRRPRKRRKKSSRSGGMSSALTMLLIFAGIGLATCLPAIFLPPLMLLPIIVGWLVSFVGGIWFLIIAFQDDAMQGILCLFVPFYSLYYLITHFDEEKTAFFMQLAGIALVMAGSCAGGIGASLAK
jgi:hypothetical protein